MHDAATSMPPQAPSTWADYLAGYRWRGQGEGCSAATVHRLEAARRPTLFVKQEVLSAHAELPAEIARLRWLHGAGIDCPQVLNETQSDGRQWLLMSAVPGTRCPRWRSAASWSPSAWCAWWPPPCAGCTISIRLPVPSTIAWNGAWTPCASGSRAGLVDEADFDDDHRGRSATGCTACCSTGVRRSKTWWSPMATPACQICWRRAALQRLHRLRPARRRRPAPGPGLGRAGHRGRTRRGLGRGLPRRIRRRYRRRTAGVLQAIGRVLLE